MVVEDDDTGIETTVETVPRRERVLGFLLGADRSRWVEQAFLRVFLLSVVGMLLSFPVFWLVELAFDWRPFANLFEETVFPDEMAETLDLERRKADAEILRNLLFALAGLVGALFGLFQLHNAARRTRISDQQKQVGEQQKDIAEKAERNDRFVKTASLLESHNQAIQIAGVYGLQGLAQEDREGYLELVIRVLVGFVRTQTGPEGRAERALEKLRGAAKALDTPGVTVRTDDAEQDNTERPTEAVNATMDALITLTEGDRNRGHLVDLRRCHLKGLEQPQREMVGWNLAGANLIDANLWRTNLSSAMLAGADLRDSTLVEANLTNANLIGANLSSFDRANVFRSAANLHFAVLLDTDLLNANLRGTNLAGVDLSLAINIDPDQLWQAANVTWPENVPLPQVSTWDDEPVPSETAPSNGGGEASSDDLPSQA
ncbi:MAG: pentapeptide repeat-containing protein [Parvularculaceae bacterium]|nr:pentapeptide repeat-containing protein [Parvularculaceae bacterium]